MTTATAEKLETCAADLHEVTGKCIAAVRYDNGVVSAYIVEGAELPFTGMGAGYVFDNCPVCGKKLRPHA